MDQIRKALVWLKKYHFWVLSVLVAVIALACWKMAAAKLSQELATNSQAIKSEFTNQENLRNQPFHPNDNINQKQVEQIDLQSKNVEEIWKTLFERQSKEVLTWPKDLSPEFRDYVAKHKFGDSIPRALCENYRDYIDRHFETLPKQIGARVIEETAPGGGGGFMRGGRGMFGGRGGDDLEMRGGGGIAGMSPDGVVGLDDDYLCEWLDQGLVRQELDFPTTPSPIKIWVTQENLWVYHTLLNIIANTNEAAHADRVSNAAVKTIYSLEVGRPAALASLAKGRVEILQPLVAAAPMGEEGMMGGEVGMMGGEGMLSGGERGMGMMDQGFMGERGGFGEGMGGAMSPEQEKAMLLAARYVDETGKPAGMAAAPIEGEMVDPSLAPPAAELPTGPFKRLPIRMTLRMDQRWLNHLIAECASQPLPVEVTEVRINPADAGGMMGGGEGGFRSGGLDGMGGGGGSSYQPRMNSSGTTDVMTFQQHPNVATVVIQGIVTIFNEPDPNVLKASAPDQMAVVE